MKEEGVRGIKDKKTIEKEYEGEKEQEAEERNGKYKKADSPHTHQKPRWKMTELVSSEWTNDSWWRR